MSPEQKQHLIEAYLAGFETDLERAQLDAMLQSDPEARRQVADGIAFDAVLAEAVRRHSVHANIGAESVSALPPVTRRKFSWRMAAAALAGVGTPSIVAASLANETGTLRSKNAALVADNQRLQSALTVVQKLLGAFTLAGDAPDGSTPGPGAVLSGTNVVTVAGYLDPEIIRRVVVIWDAEDAGRQEQTIYSGDDPASTGVSGSGFFPFSVQHTVDVQPGRVVSVVVKADAVDTAERILRRIQQGEFRLERQAWFLGSEYGLVVKPAEDWVVTNLLPGTLVADDFFVLEGNAFVDGNLAVCHQSNDGTVHLLASPIRLRKNSRLAFQQLDFGLIPNGNRTVRLLLVSDEAARNLAATPLDQALPELPIAMRQIVVPIQLQLPSATLRAVKYVIDSGGSVKPHGSEQSIRNVSQFDSQARVQEVDLSYCRVALNLTRLRGLRQLQSLKLSGTRVDDTALQGISLRHPDLRWLELSDTAITDRAVVEDLVHYPHLIMLGLSSNTRITNASVEAIARQFMELEDLSLRATSVTSVLPLLQLKKLTALHVRDSSIPQAELDELSAALPVLKIER